jgi:hypothetical protein
MELDFLGHHILAWGVEADSTTAGQMLSWPVPTSATEVFHFCGLVHYISSFLPNFTTHTRVLQELTMKECYHYFPTWTLHHQEVFDGVKHLVSGRECLTSINYNLLDTHKIFVTTDTSVVST